jgi:hypothetical protein
MTPGVSSGGSRITRSGDAWRLESGVTLGVVRPVTIRSESARRVRDGQEGEDAKEAEAAKDRRQEEVGSRRDERRLLERDAAITVSPASGIPTRVCEPGINS